jgi:predicted RNA-binding protein
MCLSKVYFERGGKKEILLDEVASVTVDDGKLQLKTLFGEQKEINAQIKEIDLMAHTILLQDAGVNG